MIGSSSSVVSTVSRLPRVKMVERFLNVALEEKKLEALLRSEQTGTDNPYYMYTYSSS